jgi:hypothetical protein
VIRTLDHTWTKLIYEPVFSLHRPGLPGGLRSRERARRTVVERILIREAL